MSYEGSEEFLCAKGHHWTQNCYNDFPHGCPKCGSVVKYWRAIDYTNGYDEDSPGTYPANLVTIGYEDEWNADHYGNEYAVMVELYKPEDENLWRRVEL